MSIQFLYTLTMALFGAGLVGAVLFYKHDRFAHYWAHSLTMLASLSGLIMGIRVLREGALAHFELLTWTTRDVLGHDVVHGLATTTPFSVSIDVFSALFIVLIAVLTFCASWYGMAYMKHYEGKYSLARFGVWYVLFAASLIGVASTQSVFTFLWWWEIMSLSSYFLVTYDYRNASSVRAGTLYLVMTQIGTACIAVAMIILALATGSSDFAAIGGASVLLTGWLPHGIFALFLIGFGIKAGIIPLHIWLPQAHPAAPSHVSALMSGVMIKLAIYMIIRVLFEILPTFHLWWGIVIVIAGAVSALFGVLYALAEHDMKRLLAYHSVENIGIILLGIGSSVIFKSMGLETLALLALVAGVFHTINHALFKSLLFLGAGAVVYKTHARDIEKYGGLIKLMPWTAALFLVGAVAISGLPPFNGFASEWLTFQSMIAGVVVGAGMTVKVLWIAATIALALTSGLAAACFVKAFGVTFLGKPRSEEAQLATEVPFAMIGPMIVLAVACFACGVFATPVVIPYLSTLLQGVMVSAPPLVLVQGDGGMLPWVSTLSNHWALLILLLAGAGTVLVVRLWGGKRKITLARQWDCGVDQTARMEITASSFSRSLVTMFAGILRPTRQTEVVYHDSAMRYFVSSHAVHLHLHDLYDLYFYRPISRCVLWCSGYAKRLQGGVVNMYILYIVLALVVLFFVALR